MRVKEYECKHPAAGPKTDLACKCKSCLYFTAKPQEQPKNGDDITEHTHVNLVTDLIEKSTQAVWSGSSGPQYLPNVQEAYRSLLGKAITNLPQKPCEATGKRRVVLLGGNVAGGINYERLNYLQAEALRHFGWKGRIELWHDPIKEQVRPKIFEPFDVRIVDANEVRKRHPMRVWAGWERKSFCGLFCATPELEAIDDEVLILDADNLVISDVTTWFDSNPRGHVIWYNLRSEEYLLHMPWKILGLEQGFCEKPFTGGQYLFRKSNLEALRLLALWHHLNNHADYYYKNHWPKGGLVWGDQDTLRMAYAALKVEPYSYSPWSWGRGPAMLTHTPFFGEAKAKKYQVPFYATVHRFRDKDFAIRDQSLPHEDFFHGLVAKYGAFG